jgi:hypothetical protein
MTNAQRNKPFDLDDLLHPEQAFDHPHDVVNDTDLTLNEKRAILASWASDACAVEMAPALRQVPGCQRVVPVDEILEALQALDKQVDADLTKARWARRQIRRHAFEVFRSRRRDAGDTGSGLSH